MASTGSASAAASSSLRSVRSDSSCPTATALPNASAASSASSSICGRFGLPGSVGATADSSTRNSAGALFASRSAVISASAFFETSDCTFTFSISASRSSSANWAAVTGAAVMSLSTSAMRDWYCATFRRPRLTASVMRRISRSLAAARARACSSRAWALPSSRESACTSGWSGRSADRAAPSFPRRSSTCCSIRPTSVSRPAGSTPIRSMRCCAVCMKPVSTSICLASWSRSRIRASFSSGSVLALARLKAAIFASAFPSSARICASCWAITSRVRATWPALTWRLPSMNSSARRLAVFAATAGSRERTVMVKASSPSPCTSVSLRSASTAPSMPSFSRVLG